MKLKKNDLAIAQFAAKHKIVGRNLALVRFVDDTITATDSFRAVKITLPEGSGIKGEFIADACTIAGIKAKEVVMNVSEDGASMDTVYDGVVMRIRKEDEVYPNVDKVMEEMKNTKTTDINVNALMLAEVLEFLGRRGIKGQHKVTLRVPQKEGRAIVIECADAEAVVMPLSR